MRVSVPAVRPLRHLCVAATLLVAISGSLPAAAQRATPRSPEESAKAKSAETSAETSVQPAPASGQGQVSETPQGEWLVDESTSRRYRIAKIPRVENTFVWLTEDRIRVPLGGELEVERHDDEYFWVRDYERPPLARRPPKEPPPPEPPLPLLQPESVDALAFATFDDGLPRSGLWRNGFDLGDINGDGHLDILFGPARKSTRPTPNLFLGDGEGTWRRWSEARFEPAPYDYGDAVGADWNGDGRLDLGLGIHLRGMVALIQEPAGVFSLWSDGIGLGDGSTGAGFASREISAVDWNGDGRVDLVALAEGPQAIGGASRRKVGNSRGFILFLNQGDGTWQDYSLSGGGGAEREFGKVFVRGDFDGDGSLEIVLASGLYKNPRVLLQEHREPPYLRPAKLPQLYPNAQITALAAADVDRDGIDDLAVGFLVQKGDEWRTGLDILYGGAAPEAWRRLPLTMEEGRVWIDALAFGDLDGEGPIDLVALTGQGGVRAYLGAEDGFRLETGDDLPVKVAEGCHGSEVHIADLNGDRRGEIVAAFAGEKVGFLPGIEGLYDPGCPQGGSLRVWSPRPLAASEPAQR